MPQNDIEQPELAKEAYAIWRGSLRNNDLEKLFPHPWETLPDHYKRLLAFMVGYSNLHNTEMEK